MSIELFTQKTCRPCMELKIFMRGQGIHFTERYIDSDEVAKADFDALGLMSTPVVKINSKVLIGNNDDTRKFIQEYASISWE